jgi:hypothetical protein
MATMAAILDGLESEIRQKVCAVEPQSKAQPRFTSPKSLKHTNLRNQPGTPRLFQVFLEPKTPIMYGTITTRPWDVEGRIVIGYPAESLWDNTISSDYQQIFDTLNLADCAVDGVSYRHVPVGEQYTQENVEGWRWVSIPLYALVITSPS